MYFATNLKTLRKHRGRSQEEVAAVLGIKRTTYSAYENGATEPSLDTLLKITRFFKISVERLLTEDISGFTSNKLEEMTHQYDVDITGRKLRILATTLDSHNRENIELVGIKAKAGYTAGYADPDFISVLPAFHLPFLDREKKYRTFQIAGDSMPPVAPGSWVTGAYVQDWSNLKSGTPCIVVTREEGAVFKIVQNRIPSHGTLMLCSTNPAYPPYEVALQDLLEIWSFVHFISADLPEPQIPGEEIQRAVLKLQQDMEDMKKKVGQA